MSIIKQPLLFAGSLGEKYLYTLFDSGRFDASTNLSCINPEYLADLEIPTHLSKRRTVGIRMMGTAAEGHYIEVTHRVSLDFYMDDVLLSDEFLVIPGLSEEAIIGAATMQKWRIKLDFEHDIAIVERNVAPSKSSQNAINIKSVFKFKKNNKMLKSKIFTALLIMLSISVFAGNTPAKKDGTTGIQFFNGTFKEALAKAKKENKMVMMDCFTTWCGPCKTLKKQVFVDKALGDYMNAKYVCVGMDYENGEGPAVAQMYPVDGYPTLLFMDASGKVKKSMVGVPQPTSSAAGAILSLAKKYGK